MSWLSSIYQWFLQWQVTFDRPMWLLLLFGLPILWALSYRSLANLGKYRRMFAIGLRTLVMTALILALAEIQLLQTSHRLTVIYCLDQSESIPIDQRESMLEYVVREVLKHRRADRRDRAGVIVFGREPVFEVPPFEDDIPSAGVLESFVRSDATNLAGALKLAQASFEGDSARRVVVVTDGNENLGDAREIARTMADNGVGIDVVPIMLERNAEVSVEKIVMPSDARKGQPLEARVVVNNSAQPTDDFDGNVKGRLTLSRQIGSHVELLNPGEESQIVTLKPGKNVFRFPHQIDQAAVYTYKADFTPLNEEDDAITQNNRATAFTHVRGQGRILLIEDWENKGEFDYLVERMRANNLEVTVQGSDELFSSLAELQGYDTVILANVPRSSGNDAQTVTNFSDDQIEMLVRNTQQMGCGLVMLGGDRSFGAGGWSNTELEEAMPVDFQITNKKIQAVGALALMMHASEMAQGNYWQKITAQEAIKALGPMDYCGLIHWSGTDQWLWGNPVGIIRVGNQRQKMLAQLSRMQPGDMPQFDPAMKKALAALKRVPASVKHMIIISDGDPSPPNPFTVAGYRQAKIKISTVAVGTHGPAGSKPLSDLATATQGKYYRVTNPKALPRIYQREARRVARPLIYEPEGGFVPRVVYPHEMVRGIDSFPPADGFVMTSLKQNPLVEVAVRSPVPTDEQGGAENSTILASWTYGLGRSVVFTTDAGHRWTDTWTGWDNYDKFFTQMIRWSMRPSGDEGKFTVDTDFKDGKVRVVVTALDQDDEFLNFLNMSAASVDPDLEADEVDIKQVAPGRYVGEFEASKDGSYFLTISPGPGKAPILAGVSVPYSAEYRDRETNMGLIKSLAGQKPKGGAEGEVIIGPMDPQRMDDLLQVDTFRHTLEKAISSNDAWPFLVVFASCMFFFDVLVRRVMIGFEWIKPIIQWVKVKVFGADEQPVVQESLARLRSRKAEIAGNIDERRAATRFEPVYDESESTPPDVLDETGQRPPAAQPPGGAVSPEEVEEEDYTSRLMKAKKRAWKKDDE